MEANYSHVSKMSNADMVKLFSKPSQGESHEDHLDRVVIALGINAFKTYGSKVGIGGLTKGEKSDPKGAVVYELVAKGIFSNMEIIGKISNSAMARSAKPANYSDVFDRLANVGIQQELVYYKGSGDNSEQSAQIAEYLDSSKHDIKPEVVKNLINKFIVVASVEHKVVGVATTLDGNLDYSKNKDGLKPVEIVSHGPGLSRIADVLSLAVMINGDSISLINPTEAYIGAGQLTRLFKQPKTVINTCGALVMDLFARYKNTQPSVKGTGAQLQKWMYDFLRYVFSIGSTDLLKQFDMFAKIWNANIVAKGGTSLRFQISNGAIVCALASPPFSMSKVYDSNNLIVDGKSTYTTARDSLVNRRKTEMTGSTGISGLTLSYAVGVNLPPRVLDVLGFAADIGGFIKEKEAIALNITGGNKLEVMLRALVYLKYTGKVWCAEYKPALKLAQAHDVNKGTRNAISGYAREFKFGKSEFTVIGKTPNNDIPTIYYDLYNFNKKFKDHDEFTTYCLKTKQEIMGLIEANTYLVNVPLVEGMEGDGVYQAFEAHNMWGWETNDVPLMKRLKTFSEKQIQFYKDALPVGYFIQPFNALTRHYAYARTLIANTTRIQYPYTGCNFFTACQNARIIAKVPPPGDLSGILSDVIMINGLTIEAVANDAELLAVLSSEGSEEVKHLLRIHTVGARKEKKDKDKVDEDNKEEEEGSSGGKDDDAPPLAQDASFDDS